MVGKVYNRHMAFVSVRKFKAIALLMLEPSVEVTLIPCDLPCKGVALLVRSITPIKPPPVLPHRNSSPSKSGKAAKHQFEQAAARKGMPRCTLAQKLGNQQYLSQTRVREAIPKKKSQN